MTSSYKKKLVKRDMPDVFDQAMLNTIRRIEANSNVMGIMYFRQDCLQLCTITGNMTQTLSNKLPQLTSNFQRAVGEIVNKYSFIHLLLEHSRRKKERNILLDGVKALHLITFCYLHNIINDLTMKIISNLLKDSHDEWLVRTTASLNKINPIVDRIMEDDSVQSVVMTNKEGVPVLSNTNATGATNYGRAMRRLGYMTHICVTEIDTFDEVLVLRIKTKKMEVMVAPHPQFNIIVIQHARTNKKTAKGIKEQEKFK